ncbi:hypothetical protein Thi970DRAFT_00299 [Thiorhodovibrio frisius]|uniref:Uncharacterized protein n=2 Tax=Thiorhodovibrio frisius TaxID=631362 RepID=H8YVZ7_9GAMM|nr:hypothetical protein Thi970DRAFT_00299 [Thiorhodovibrio frisius]WPL23203.1 hypothetical protein Thiofri_03386 [Thiorhodovibrio frisius]
MAALAQRLTVRPVRPANEPERTEKPSENQHGSPGSPGSPENNKRESEPRGERARLWLVTTASGDVLTVSYCPLAPLAKVQADYAGASIEPAPAPEHGGELDPSDAALVVAWLDAIGETATEARAQYLATCASDPHALAWTLAELATTAPEVDAPALPQVTPSNPPEVACCHCWHFTTNAINPRGGIGRCAVDSPASHRNPALWPWPAAVHPCRDWRPILEGDAP